MTCKANFVPHIKEIMPLSAIKAHRRWLLWTILYRYGHDMCAKRA
jgi:hypothetical protein